MRDTVGTGSGGRAVVAPAVAAVAAGARRVALAEMTGMGRVRSALELASNVAGEGRVVAVTHPSTAAHWSEAAREVGLDLEVHTLHRFVRGSAGADDLTGISVLLLAERHAAHASLAGAAEDAVLSASPGALVIDEVRAGGIGSLSRPSFAVWRGDDLEVRSAKVPA